MKLAPFKCILVKCSEKEKMGDKPDSGSKQTLLLKIPARKISDEWGNEREIREECYEADVINNKIEESVLKGLIGKRCEVVTAYLNGYEYKKKDQAGKETDEIAYGKSITLNAIKEVK